MVDIFVYLITCITINILLFKQILIKYEKRKSWSFTIFLFSFLTLAVSIINMLQIPFLNLLAVFISYMLLKIMLFNVKAMEGIGGDLLHFFILVFIDSLSYFITGFVYSNSTIYFRSLTSSIMILFFNTMLFNVFRFSRIEKIPKFEAILFLSITVFSVSLIYIFSLGYANISYNHKIITIFIIIGLVLLNIIVFHYLEYIHKNHILKEQIFQEELKKNMMSQHYQDMKKQYEETRKLIHDFKNHLLTMSIAYENGKNDMAKNIMDQFIKESNNIKIKFTTGSDILDIILNDKANKAEQLGIKFHFIMDNIELGWIKEFDMITIFGNLLDNAIEANIKNDIVDRYIKVKLYHKNSMVILSIKNSCINKLEVSDIYVKSTKEGHSGVGLQNVKNSINTYDGAFDIEITNNECEVIVYLLSTKFIHGMQ